MCWNADPSDNPPECNNATFDTTDVTSDMMAVTNLYPNDLVREINIAICFLYH